MARNFDLERQIIENAKASRENRQPQQVATPQQLASPTNEPESNRIKQVFDKYVGAPVTDVAQTIGRTRAMKSINEFLGEELHIKTFGAAKQTLVDKSYKEPSLMERLAIGGVEVGDVPRARLQVMEEVLAKNPLLTTKSAEAIADKLLGEAPAEKYKQITLDNIRRSIAGPDYTAEANEWAKMGKINHLTRYGLSRVAEAASAGWLKSIDAHDTSNPDSTFADQGTSYYPGLSGKVLQVYGDVAGILLGFKAAGLASNLGIKSALGSARMNRWANDPGRKMLLKLMQEVGAFTTFGQMSEDLIGDWEARGKALGSDAMMGLAFGYLGEIPNMFVKIPAEWTTIYAIGVHGGQDPEEAAITATAFATLGFLRHVSKTEQNKMVLHTARNTINKHAPKGNKLGGRMTPEQIMQNGRAAETNLASRLKAGTLKAQRGMTVQQTYKAQRTAIKGATGHLMFTFTDPISARKFTTVQNVKNANGQIIGQQQSIHLPTQIPILSPMAETGREIGALLGDIGHAQIKIQQTSSTRRAAFKNTFTAMGKNVFTSQGRGTKTPTAKGPPGFGQPAQNIIQLKSGDYFQVQTTTQGQTQQVFPGSGAKPQTTKGASTGTIVHVASGKYGAIKHTVTSGKRAGQTLTKPPKGGRAVKVSIGDTVIDGSGNYFQVQTTGSLKPVPVPPTAQKALTWRDKLYLAVPNIELILPKGKRIALIPTPMQWQLNPRNPGQPSMVAIGQPLPGLGDNPWAVNLSGVTYIMPEELVKPLRDPTTRAEFHRKLIEKGRTLRIEMIEKIKKGASQEEVEAIEGRIHRIELASRELGGEGPRLGDVSEPLTALLPPDARLATDEVQRSLIQIAKEVAPIGSRVTETGLFGVSGEQQLLLAQARKSIKDIAREIDVPADVLAEEVVRIATMAPDGVERVISPDNPLLITLTDASNVATTSGLPNVKIEGLGRFFGLDSVTEPGKGIAVANVPESPLPPPTTGEARITKEQVEDTRVDLFPGATAKLNKAKVLESSKKSTEEFLNRGLAEVYNIETRQGPTARLKTIGDVALVARRILGGKITDKQANRIAKESFPKNARDIGGDSVKEVLFLLKNAQRSVSREQLVRALRSPGSEELLSKKAIERTDFLGDVSKAVEAGPFAIQSLTEKQRLELPDIVQDKLIMDGKALEDPNAKTWTDRAELAKVVKTKDNASKVITILRDKIKETKSRIKDRQGDLSVEGQDKLRQLEIDLGLLEKNLETLISVRDELPTKHGLIADLKESDPAVQEAFAQRKRAFEIDKKRDPLTPEERAARDEIPAEKIPADIRRIPARARTGADNKTINAKLGDAWLGRLAGKTIEQINNRRFSEGKELLPESVFRPREPQAENVRSVKVKKGSNKHSTQEPVSPGSQEARFADTTLSLLKHKEGFRARRELNKTDKAEANKEIKELAKDNEAITHEKKLADLNDRRNALVKKYKIQKGQKPKKPTTEDKKKLSKINKQFKELGVKPKEKTVKLSENQLKEVTFNEAELAAVNRVIRDIDALEKTMRIAEGRFQIPTKTQFESIHGVTDIGTQRAEKAAVTKKQLQAQVKEGKEILFSIGDKVVTEPGGEILEVKNAGLEHVIVQGPSDKRPRTLSNDSVQKVPDVKSPAEREPESRAFTAKTIVEKNTQVKPVKDPDQLMASLQPDQAPSVVSRMGRKRLENGNINKAAKDLEYARMEFFHPDKVDQFKAEMPKSASDETWDRYFHALDVMSSGELNNPIPFTQKVVDGDPGIIKRINKNIIDKSESITGEHWSTPDKTAEMVELGNGKMVFMVDGTKRIMNQKLSDRKFTKQSIKEATKGLDKATAERIKNLAEAWNEQHGELKSSVSRDLETGSDTTEVILDPDSTNRSMKLEQSEADVMDAKSDAAARAFLDPEFGSPANPKNRPGTVTTKNGFVSREGNVWFSYESGVKNDAGYVIDGNTLSDAPINKMRIMKGGKIGSDKLNGHQLKKASGKIDAPEAKELGYTTVDKKTLEAVTDPNRIGIAKETLIYSDGNGISFVTSKSKDAFGSQTGIKGEYVASIKNESLRSIHNALRKLPEGDVRVSLNDGTITLQSGRFSITAQATKFKGAKKRFADRFNEPFTTPRKNVNEVFLTGDVLIGTVLSDFSPNKYAEIDIQVVPERAQIIVYGTDKNGVTKSKTYDNIQTLKQKSVTPNSGTALGRLETRFDNAIRVNTSELEAASWGRGADKSIVFPEGKDQRAILRDIGEDSILRSEETFKIYKNTSMDLQRSVEAGENVFTLSDRIVQTATDEGTASARGQKIESAQDVADMRGLGLRQVKGMENLEHVWVVMADKNNMIVKVELAGIGSQESVNASHDMLLSRVEATEGASKFWIVHNHPKTIAPEFSRADFRFADKMQNTAKPRDAEFLGSMVIDTTKYEYILPKDRVLSKGDQNGGFLSKITLEGKQEFMKDQLDKQAGRRKLDPETVARMIKTSVDPDVASVNVTLLDPYQKVVTTKQIAIDPKDPMAGFGKNLMRTVNGLRRPYKYGSPTVVVGIHGVDIRPHMKELRNIVSAAQFKQNVFFLDVVGTKSVDGRVISDTSMRVLDVLNRENLDISTQMLRRDPSGERLSAEERLVLNKVNKGEPIPAEQWDTYNKLLRTGKIDSEALTDKFISEYRELQERASTPEEARGKLISPDDPAFAEFAPVMTRDQDKSSDANAISADPLEDSRVKVAKVDMMDLYAKDLAIRESISDYTKDSIDIIYNALGGSKFKGNSRTRIMDEAIRAAAENKVAKDPGLVLETEIANIKNSWVNIMDIEKANPYDLRDLNTILKLRAAEVRGEPVPSNETGPFDNMMNKYAIAKKRGDLTFFADKWFNNLMDFLNRKGAGELRQIWTDRRIQMGQTGEDIWLRNRAFFDPDSRLTPERTKIKEFRKKNGLNVGQWQEHIRDVHYGWKSDNGLDTKYNSQPEIVKQTLQKLYDTHRMKLAKDRAKGFEINAQEFYWPEIYRADKGRDVRAADEAVLELVKGAKERLQDPEFLQEQLRLDPRFDPNDTKSLERMERRIKEEFFDKQRNNILQLNETNARFMWERTAGDLPKQFRPSAGEEMKIHMNEWVTFDANFDHFGRNNSKVSAEVEKAYLAGKLTAREARFVKERILETTHPDMAQVPPSIRKFMAIQTYQLSPFTTLVNASQFVPAVARWNMMEALKLTKDMILNNREVVDEVTGSGARSKILQQAVHEVQYGVNERTTRWIKLIGLQGMEMQLRTFSAALAERTLRAEYSRFARQAKDGTLNMNSNRFKRMAREFNRHDIDLAQTLKANPGKINLDQAMVNRIGFLAAQQTQFLSAKEELPGWIGSSKYGPAVGQFKNYAMEYFWKPNSPMRVMMEEAGHGIKTGDIVSMKPFFVMMLGAQLAGELIQDIRSMYTGRSRPLELGGLDGRIMDNMMTQAFAGVFWDMFQGARYKRFAQTLLGPTFGTVLDVGLGMQDVLSEGDFTQILKLGGRQNRPLVATITGAVIGNKIPIDAGMRLLVGYGYVSEFRGARELIRSQSTNPVIFDLRDAKEKRRTNIRKMISKRDGIIDKDVIDKVIQYDKELLELTTKASKKTDEFIDPKTLIITESDIKSFARDVILRNAKLDPDEMRAEIRQKIQEVSENPGLADEAFFDFL